MRILAALFSCSKDIANGNNQAVRDTWGKDLPSNVDLRFLLGNEEPGPVEDEHPLWQERFQNYVKQKPHMAAPPPPLPLLLPDELPLPAPDGYFYLTHKLRAGLRWALAQDYDFIFRADVDTFVDVPILLQSGFDSHNYTGKKIGPKPGYAQGGTGYWLSRAACRLLVNAPITSPADDVWVGETLLQHGINLYDDVRYCTNDARMAHLRRIVPIITVHLGEGSGKYNKAKMYAAYAAPRQSLAFGPPPNSNMVILQERSIWVPKRK